jgi:uncharacterized protein (TIGR02246 family)
MGRKHPSSLAVPGSPDEAEALFYEALQAGDLDKMMSVWADDDEVVCVHPGGERVIGTDAIRASFEAIFAQSAVPVLPDRVHRLHRPEAALHHLTERVQVLTTDGARTAWTLATNVYIKTPLGWRMVAHHASPGQLGEPSERLAEPMSTLH